MAEYLTTAGAAKYAHRHPGSIRRSLEAGELHGVQRKKGGPWSIRPACIDAYLAGEKCEHQAVTNVRQLRRRAS